MKSVSPTDDGINGMNQLKTTISGRNESRDKCPQKSGNDNAKCTSGKEKTGGTGFNFGGNNTQGFSFGNNANNGKPTFSFGGNNTGGFSFGNNANGGRPTFSFGGNTTAGGFSFGNNANGGRPTFNNGGNNAGGYSFGNSTNGGISAINNGGNTAGGYSFGNSTNGGNSAINNGGNTAGGFGNNAGGINNGLATTMPKPNMENGLVVNGINSNLSKTAPNRTGTSSESKTYQASQTPSEIVYYLRNYRIVVLESILLCSLDQL